MHIRLTGSRLFDDYECGRLLLLTANTLIYYMPYIEKFIIRGKQNIFVVNKTIIKSLLIIINNNIFIVKDMLSQQQ